MRRQDELIALYQGRGRYAQKYLLSQMGRLALAFDSEELLEFLQGQIGNADSVVASQALFSLLEFLPAYVQKRYALKDSTSGAWTQLLMDPAENQAMMAKAERMSRAGEALTRAAQLAVRPVADALLSLLGKTGGWTRTAALVTLGQFDLRTVRSQLQAELSKNAHDLVLARSVLRVSASDGPDAVLELVRREAKSNPDVFLLLSGLPADRVMPVIMDHIRQTDTTGRMNLAQVLGSLRGADIGAAYDRISAVGEGWVIVSLLDAVEQVGDPAGMRRLVQVYRAVADDFVRVQAVRAAGGLPGGEARTFCMDAARTGSDIVRAAALESLARQGVPPADIAATATGLLGSTQLKAKVNAVLAVLSPTEILEHPAFSELIMSADPLHRLEAAYCLGYLQSSRGLGLLTALAGLDPSPSVRQQATKSLSRFHANEGLVHLLGMIQASQPRHALTAARALTRYGSAEAAPAVAAILSTLERRQAPLERALLYRALGAVAQRSRMESARGALAAGLGEHDPLVLAGVLEGWNLVGATAEPMVMKSLRRLDTPSEPRLRARALMALWGAGDLDALSGLGGMIASGDERTFKPALECALEIGLLLPDALIENRFPALAERMLELAERPEIVQEAAAQLVSVPARAERREIFEVDDAFGVRRHAEEVVVEPETTPDEFEPEESEDSDSTLVPADAAHSAPGPAPVATRAEHFVANLEPEDLPELAPSAEPVPPPASAPPPAPPPTEYYAADPPPPPARPAARVPSFDDSESIIASVLVAQTSRVVTAPPRRDDAQGAEGPSTDAPAAPPPAAAAGPVVPPTLMMPAPPEAEAPARPPRTRATTRMAAPRRLTSSIAIPPAALAAAVATPAGGGGPVDRLRAFLSGLEGERAGALVESLSRATYLVTDRVSGPAARAPSPARKIALGAGVGALLVGVAFLVLTLRAPEPPGKVPGPLWVESLDGAAQTARGKTLGELTVVPTGDAVKTGPKSVLTLVTPLGNKVVVQPNSSFIFAGLEPSGTDGAQRYCFRDATGEVSFDFKKGGDLEFRSGPRRIRATRAALLVARDRKAPSLTVVSGTGYLSHDKGGETIILRSGDTIGLE